MNYIIQNPYVEFFVVVFGGIALAGISLFYLYIGLEFTCEKLSKILDNILDK